jgi:ABC-type nitrate/sulfonate/bicarbonate transport system substrate-binding protein
MGRQGSGIFQRHGLDVELVYIASGSRAVQTLVGGSIDIAAIGGPAGVDAKLAGADTVYIAIPVNRCWCSRWPRRRFNASKKCAARVSA